MGEEILEDIQAYNTILESYDFKTEQLRIDLNAAVMNLHKVKDHVVKEHLPGKAAVHKAVPADVDYDKLAPYFLHRSKNVIKKTLENTTQYAKALIMSPLRRHLCSRFLMLCKPRLNEVIATDIYFPNVKSIEGYHCAQVFVGMTSRRITTIGMKTKSEFPMA